MFSKQKRMSTLLLIIVLLIVIVEITYKIEEEI